MMKRTVLITSLYILSLHLCPAFQFNITTHGVYTGFPHQIGVADIICTGTVLTNNDDFAEMSLNEVLWGYAPSSKITVRCLDRDDRPAFSCGEAYLVFAYTNNWWGSDKLWQGKLWELSNECLLDYLTATNKPANNAVFSDFRIMNSTQSVIRLGDLVVGGTNYWPPTRTFITNFIDIARIRNDEVEAYRCVSTFGDLRLRRKEKSRLHRYLYFRYLGTEYLK